MATKGKIGPHSSENHLKAVDPRVTERIAGAAWEGIRQRFSKACSHLLGVSPASTSELTTIYVKFSVTEHPGAEVFAVAWLKSSKNVVIGFALPDDFSDPQLTPAPSGMVYQGLTRYYAINSNSEIPSSFPAWANTAFQIATSRSSNSGE